MNEDNALVMRITITPIDDENDTKDISSADPGGDGGRSPDEGVQQPVR
jgi:hypothetical protein